MNFTPVSEIQRISLCEINTTPFWLQKTARKDRLYWFCRKISLVSSQFRHEIKKNSAIICHAATLPSIWINYTASETKVTLFERFWWILSDFRFQNCLKTGWNSSKSQEIINLPAVHNVFHWVSPPLRAKQFTSFAFTSVYFASSSIFPRLLLNYALKKSWMLNPCTRVYAVEFWARPGNFRNDIAWEMLIFNGCQKLEILKSGWGGAL